MAGHLSRPSLASQKARIARGAHVMQRAWARITSFRPTVSNSGHDLLPNVLAPRYSPAILTAGAARIAAIKRTAHPHSTMPADLGRGYDSWEKPELIRRIEVLESRLADLDNGGGSTDTLQTQTPESKKRPRRDSPPVPAASGHAAEQEGEEGDIQSKKDKKKKKRAKEFDFARFPQRKIALKLSYFGWPYHGFARQGNLTEDADAERADAEYPTVEGELFRALKQCRLIQSESACGYSRCGRTDRGVSGLGQVVSLYVRSNGRFDEAGCPVLPCPEDEYPYVKMLNKALPQAVRIHAWAPVQADFDARFSCRSRFYRYLLYSGGHGELDIARMRDAAARFVGTHDFRNFCRLDPAKQIKNFERTVLSADIVPVRAWAADMLGAATANSSNDNGDFGGDGGSDGSRGWWQLELRGTAFLWHQVRCMMGVLFLVGQGYEEPGVVNRLLDVAVVTGKPSYEMASDMPLVLADCEFDADDVQWRYYRQPDEDVTAMILLERSVRQQWQEHAIKALIASSLYRQLNGIRVRTKHVPLSAPVSAPAATESGGGDDDNSNNNNNSEVRPPTPLGECTWLEYRELGYGRRSDGIDFVRGGGHVHHARRHVPLLERPQAAPVEKRNRDWLERKQQMSLKE